MRKALFVILFAFLPLSAFGQLNGQSLVHDFGEYKVYQRINKVPDKDVSWLETARFEDRVCTDFYVQPISIEDSTLEVGTRTEWEMERTDGGILFTFPKGAEVEYKFTEKDGAAQCIAQMKRSRDI